MMRGFPLRLPVAWREVAAVTAPTVPTIMVEGLTSGNEKLYRYDGGTNPPPDRLHAKSCPPSETEKNHVPKDPPFPRGRQKAPLLPVVVADSRAPRDGRFIERLGTYNPMLKKDGPVTRLVLDSEKAKAWIAKGAKPTDRVLRLLDARRVEAEQRNNPKKASPEKRRRSAPQPQPLLLPPPRRRPRPRPR